MSYQRCDRTLAWAALESHFNSHGKHFQLAHAFAGKPRRFENFSVEAPEVFADLSKNLIDEVTLSILLALANEAGLPKRRNAMFAGAPLNVTEGRAVGHWRLRAPKDDSPQSAQVHETLDAMLAYAEQVRNTAQSGIRHVVNIGIGGSDLGPQMMVTALNDCVAEDMHFHFVSNVDGHDLAAALKKVKPDETLFIIASKTFTTLETMANAQAAKEWFLAEGGTDLEKHFVATTTAVDKAAAFGITTTFGFWDWVGGRYSLWSAIGLPIAIAIGEENFREMLEGAHAMDEHFAHTPIAQNLPVLLGLIDLWYRNFHGFTSRCVAPYHQDLKRLPAYLQQLEMESNGKRVDLDGQLLPYSTSPVVWGEPGTNGQHAFFQMLHQGTEVIPVEFILVKLSSHNWGDMHTKLLANGLAQAQALMVGKTPEQAVREQAPTASPHIRADMLAHHRSFPGNRPSTTLVLNELSPRSLGALIALYEHRVFVSGALWGINSFDQWGVELGKALCSDLLHRFDTGDTEGLDGSTAGLLRRLTSA